ncbi:MAG: hypothetical protein JL50_20230 [Peptococcaceae bacterium BICA1-7]|nr:MAG: hypothetical protein JL50_20230 [Peptococcaceae bacterium BICA1-7]HBV98409.1 DUF72 domain-containing protein [Desulfotomaculum sp.]
MIYVGTAGYSYDDWKGTVYPLKADKKEMLSLYVEQFMFTEVNSTYYRLPNKYMIYNMQAKTPQDFRFVIKAYQSLTHQRSDNRQDFALFAEALQPLVEAGKLGCVLAQFPQSFRLSGANVAYVKDLAKGLEGLPIVVEFRHGEWVREDIFLFLTEQGLGYVCVDEPRLKGLMPPESRATSKIAYVRFHGRNSEKWWNHKESYERYDYLYSKEELAEWVPGISGLARRAETVYVSMNNHYRGQAVVNGRMLRDMLKVAGEKVL